VDKVTHASEKTGHFVHLSYTPVHILHRINTRNGTYTKASGEDLGAVDEQQTETEKRL